MFGDPSGGFEPCKSNFNETYRLLYSLIGWESYNYNYPGKRAAPVENDFLPYGK